MEESALCFILKSPTHNPCLVLLACLFFFLAFPATRSLSHYQRRPGRIRLAYGEALQLLPVRGTRWNLDATLCGELYHSKHFKWGPACHDYSYYYIITTSTQCKRERESRDDLLRAAASSSMSHTHTRRTNVKQYYSHIQSTL
jgi:hypothetical protein